MNQYNTLANTWDDNASRIMYSEAVGTYIAAHINKEQRLQALEVGADIGTISIILEGEFSRIDLLESSKEQVAYMTKKLEARHLYHLSPMHGSFVNYNPLVAYDVVYSAMFLHHIIDTEFAIKKFYNLIQTGGKLFLCDLYSEDGRFHANATDGVYHHGFDPDVLANNLKNTGFAINNIQTIYNFDENDRLYPMFLIEATKL